VTHDEKLYTPRFFLLFAVVLFFMTGYALQFHFGEYMAHLGQSARVLGWVWGLGVAGSLCIRPVVGSFIDRIGAKPAILIGASLAMFAALGYPFTQHVGLVCLLRVLTNVGMAVFFTAIAYVTALIASPRRRAESLGIVGVGGFVGMMLGPSLGDLIFAHGGNDPKVFYLFFNASALGFLLAATLGLLLPIDRPAPSGHESVGSVFRVAIEHWPGMILIIGVAFTMGQCMHSLFLERLADARGFENIKSFFLAYSPTAIALRFIFRRLPERFGRRRTVIMGMLFYASGMLLLKTAHTSAGLILPAMVAGAGHCFVFPSMVDLGAERLPPAHRATGTAMILGAGDVGFLLGGVLWGQVIDRFGYDVMLMSVAGVCAVSAVLYGWSQRAVVFRWPPAPKAGA
jgi:MFS family permease